MGEPRTIDFGTRRGWGHDYTYKPTSEGGLTAQITGWSTPRPMAGDYLILQDGPDRTTRYQATDVRHYSNVNDMWTGSFVVAPRPPIAKDDR